MTPEEQYEQYKQQRVQRQKEDEALASERQRIREAWMMRCNPEPVKTRVPHVCERCGETIPKGSYAQKRLSIINTSTYGWDGSYVTKYRHAGECPK